MAITRSRSRKSPSSSTATATTTDASCTVATSSSPSTRIREEENHTLSILHAQPSSSSSSTIDTTNTIKTSIDSIHSPTNINGSTNKRRRKRRKNMTPSPSKSKSKSTPSSSSRPKKRQKIVEQTLNDLLQKSYQLKPVNWSTIHSRITSHPHEVETKHLNIVLMVTNPTTVPPIIVRDLVRFSKNIFTFSALQFAFTCPWVEKEVIRALIDSPLRLKGKLRILIQRSWVGNDVDRDENDNNGGDGDENNNGGDEEMNLVHRNPNESNDNGGGNNQRDSETEEEDYNSNDDRSTISRSTSNDDDDHGRTPNEDGNIVLTAEDFARQILKQSKLHSHCSNLLHTLFEPSDNLPPRFDAVKIMLECIPQVLEIQDGSDNDLPIHSACWSDQNMEYIDLFVDTALEIENPVFNYGGIMVTNQHGISPMKLIVQKWEDEKGANMLKRLIDRTNVSPTSIAAGRLLHEAVVQKKWKMVKTLIQASPISLTKATGIGRDHIPLHEMCELFTSTTTTIPPTAATTTLHSEIIQFMIEQSILNNKEHSHCGGLMCKDYYSKTPFALLSSCNSITSGASMAIIKNVLKFIHTKKKVNSRLYLSVIIHEAINIQDWDLVKYIIETYPKALLLKDKSENLPMHLLCKSDAPFEAPFEVIKLAIENGMKDNVLGKKKRAGLLEVNKVNERPLQLIVARKVTFNWKLLRFMQDFKPKLITKKDIKDFKLLHKVAAGGRVAVAKMLLKLVPKAVAIQDENGDLPLHVVLRERPCKANRDMLKILLNYSVKEQVGGAEGHYGLMVMNNNSKAPIDHVMLKCYHSDYGFGDHKRWIYLNILLSQAPDTPVLHRALHVLVNGCPLVRTIVERYPKSSSIRDESGKYPLQVALQKSKRESLVTAIVDAHPAALDDFEESSGLPCFAFAATKGDVYSLDFVYSILNRNPTFLSTQHWVPE